MEPLQWLGMPVGLGVRSCSSPAPSFLPLRNRSFTHNPGPFGKHTEVICKAMKVHARYRHLRVDWVGESSTESITLCGGANEDSGTEQVLCPNCAQVRDALNVCGLGPESLRELFDTLRVIDPSEVKAKMEALRDLGVQMDMQDRSQLN